MDRKKYTKRIINLISLLVIILVLNLIAYDSYYKIDLTENKLYTISNATKKILGSLNDKVTIKVVTSTDIPSPYNSRIRYFINLLKEYENYSKGKISLDVIATDKTEDLDKMASLYSIPPLQVNAIENDNLQIKKIYMGAVFIYRDKKQDIPVIANVENVEYEVSTIINNLASSQKAKIALIDAGSSANMRKDIAGLYKTISKNYDVEPLKIANGKVIDKKFDLALLISPQSKLEDYEVYALEEFLMSGKNIILALDLIQGSPQSGYAYSVETGLDNFLKINGLNLKKEIIYDANASIITVQGDAGGFNIATSIRYPFFPQIVNFNKDHSISKNLTAANLIYPTPINIEVDNTTKDNITYTTIAKTSNFSGLEKPPYNVSIERDFTREDFNKGPQTVAVLASGTFKSEFDKPLAGYEDNFRKSGEGKMFLITDGDFIKDQYISSANNDALLLNSIDYLLSDPELAMLRGKKHTFNPITINDVSLQNFLKYSSIFLPLLLAAIVIFIIGRIYKARRQCL